MNNKIENPKTPIQEGINYNDFDFANIIMTLEKNMSNNYSIAIDEASNDDLFDEYYEMFDSIKEAARKLYQFSFQNGWYSLTKAEATEISTKLQDLQNKMESLNLSE